MQRAEMLRWLAEAYPEYAIHDAGDPAPHSGLRELICSKNLPLLGLTLRTPKETVLDMAEAMLAHGVVQQVGTAIGNATGRPVSDGQALMLLLNVKQ